MLLSLTPCKMRRLQDRLEALKSIRSQREVRAPFVVRMPVRQIRHALTHHASFPFRLIHQAWRLLANQWSPELTASLVSRQKLPWPLTAQMTTLMKRQRRTRRRKRRTFLPSAPETFQWPRHPLATHLATLLPAAYKVPNPTTLATTASSTLPPQPRT